MQKTFEDSAMTTKTVPDSNPQRDDSNLDRRYGEIGIPAVAAAVRYQSDAKNPRYAPVVPREDLRLLEVVAA
jgi:hypothetical protein